jgi:phosphoribosylglycinamide formyltransferase-1
MFNFAHMQQPIPQIAIFASGNGSNAENIITTLRDKHHIPVAVVISNKPDAYALTRARRLGVDTLYISNDDFARNPQLVISELRQRHVTIIALAGFMRRVHSDIVRAFPGRILNIHPSLLPAYGGKGMWGHHVHEAVIAAGERHSGATVHIVSEEIDKGDILIQGRIDVAPTDTPDTLAAKIHTVEHSIYPAALLALLRR